MTAKSYSSLCLLSINVNGLFGKDKRRSLFNLLRRDQWDVILQETHHSSKAEGKEWAQECPYGLRPNWAGARFLSHGTTASCGVAILFRPQAAVTDFTASHIKDGRTLMVGFTFCDTPFTTLNVYAPAFASARRLSATQAHPASGMAR
jgi:exonuclease III